MGLAVHEIVSVQGEQHQYVLWSFLFCVWSVVVFLNDFLVFR